MARLRPPFPRRLWLKGCNIPLGLLFPCLLVAAFSTPLISADRQAYRTAYGCEGATLSITCDQGHVINVIRANYGRFSITICNNHGNTEWSVNCQSPRTHRVLADRCSGENSCFVGVSSQVFGDPCPSTFKYIEVHYTCGLATTSTTTARPRPPWFTETRDPMWLPPTLNSSLATTTPTTPSSHATSARASTSAAPTSPTTTTSSTTTESTTTATTQFSSTSYKPSPQHSPEFVVTVSQETNELNKSGLDPPKKNKSHEVFVQHPTQSPEGQPSSVTPEVPVKVVPVTPPTFGRVPYDDVPWCAPSFVRGLYWNWTRAGETAVLVCPEGATGSARRKCLVGDWKGPADLSECRSAWLTALKKRANTQDSVLAVATDLAKVTASKSLYGGDLITAARLIKSLSRRMMQDVAVAFPEPHQKQALVTEFLLAALETGSALVSAGLVGPWRDLSPKERRYAVTELMVGLEEATFLLGDVLPRATQAVHFRSHVLASARAVAADGSSVKFPSPEDELIDWVFTDSSLLPPEAILENSEGSSTRVIFLTYRHLEDLLAPEDHNFRGSHPRNNNASLIVNSRVVSASLGHGRHIQLPEPVTLTFSLLKHDNVSNPICAFWDYTTYGWSDEGCYVHSFNRTHVVCKCDHLTNFAVIMEESSGLTEEKNVSPLRILAYVGCFVCLLCVAGSILVFSLFKGISSPRTYIQRHVCVCLLVAELAFLIGVWRTDLPVLCGVTAGVLHYSVLAAFAWMFLEGIHVYLSVTRPVESDCIHLRWWHYVMAYGGPLLVVCGAAIVDPFSFGTPDYCWLRTDNYFVFSLVGPALLFLAMEVALLAVALIRTCKFNPDEALKTKEMARLASSRSWLRSAVTLLLLMVLTWSLGLLLLHQPSLPVAVAFCVFNALHGIFIFVYYCVRNQKFLPTMCHVGGLKGHASPPPTAPPFPAGGTSIMGSRASLRQVGGSAGCPLPMGTLHQSLPRSHPPPSTSTTTITATTTPLPHASLNVPQSADEDASYKSFSRDSGHGGSEQEDSPRTPWIGQHTRHAQTLSSSGDLKGSYLNKMNALNQLTPKVDPAHGCYIPSTYSAALSPNAPSVTPAITAMLRAGAHRSHSPWNHTYMEIETEPDPVYEEIERERWGRHGGVGGTCSEAMQVSDLSDEDVKRGPPSDVSRQSSRSYGDSRPLLPYIQQQQQLPSQGRPHQENVSHGQFALSEERLRDFNAAQMCRDLEQLQKVQQKLSRENLMTVAVLNGEQVVCRLSSPSHASGPPQSLPIIHEGNRTNPSSVSTGHTPTGNGYPPSHFVGVRPPHTPHFRQYNEC